MTEMYDKLSALLNRKRTTLLVACRELDIDPKLVDIEKLSVVSCDWCGVWEKPSRITTDPDGSNYCPACVESDYL